MRGTANSYFQVDPCRRCNDLDTCPWRVNLLLALVHSWTPRARSLAAAVMEQLTSAPLPRSPFASFLQMRDRVGTGSHGGEDMRADARTLVRVPTATPACCVTVASRLPLSAFIS